MKCVESIKMYIKMYILMYFGLIVQIKGRKIQQKDGFNFDSKILKKNYQATRLLTKFDKSNII